MTWTNAAGAMLYNVDREKEMAGYQAVGTTSGSPYVDNTADNLAYYYYSVRAASDASGNCISVWSTVAYVPYCDVATGNTNRATHASSAYCLVTCDDLSSWSLSGGGDRTLFINGLAYATNGAALPTKVNSGYAFYLTESLDGTGNDFSLSLVSSAGHTCP